MAFFSDANLEAVGIKPKMRLCEKCGRSMIFTPGEGFCCPAGHGCEWPKERNLLICCLKYPFTLKQVQGNMVTTTGEKAFLRIVTLIQRSGII